MQGADRGREHCKCLSVLTIKAMLFKALQSFIDDDYEYLMLGAGICS